MLVELRVGEQRYRAVWEVLDGASGTIAAIAKPLRCRLRLHAREYRENPETHEHYQVCARCNAYRDRGGSAFDGRGAWGPGGGQ